MTSDHHLILALEASAGRASVALASSGAKDDAILASTFIDAAYGHAGWMVSMVDQVLAEAGRSHDDIGIILGGTGPGSFTGIRVALAAAKGFGLVQNITPKGISSMLGLAATVAGSLPILSLIDSRRKTTFFQLFDSDLSAVTEIKDGGADDLLKMLERHQDILAEGFIVTGHANQDMVQLLRDAGLNAIAQGHDDPEAEGLIAAFQKNPEIVTIAEPLYLAPPILGISAKQDPVS